MSVVAPAWSRRLACLAALVGGTLAVLLGGLVAAPDAAAATRGADGAGVPGGLVRTPAAHVSGTRPDGGPRSDDGATTDHAAANRDRASRATANRPAGRAAKRPTTDRTAADRDAAKQPRNRDGAGDTGRAGPGRRPVEGTIPGGGGFVTSSSDEAGAYAFAVRRGGGTYVVTARHVAPAGSRVYGPDGLLGESTAVSHHRDTAYVRTAGATADGRVRIGTARNGRPREAAVSGVAPRGSVREGDRVCHSGYAESTQDGGGYVCGTVTDVPRTCATYRASSGCEITMTSDDGERIGWLGDSGGPVWRWSGDGRVSLVGVFVSVSSSRHARSGAPDQGQFVPAYDVLADLGGTAVTG